MLSKYEMYLCILSQEHDDVKELWELALAVRWKFEKYNQMYDQLRYIFVAERIQKVALKLKLRQQRRYRDLDLLVKLLRDNEVYESC